MKTAKYIFLRLLSLPPDVLGFLATAVVMPWAGALDWRSGCLVAVFGEDSWPCRTWYRRWNGTALGHFILLHPRAANDELVLYHELRHVEQYETFSVLGAAAFVLLLSLGHVFPAVAAWILSGFLGMIAAMGVAWLRGEQPYRGSFLEEAAYDAAELRRQQGEKGGAS